MLFCTNCKQMILYNPGYCPSCGMLFTSVDLLSEHDRIHAETLHKKWLDSSSKRRKVRVSLSQNEQPVVANRQSQSATISPISPGRRRLPKGLISSIISVLVVIIVSIAIYFLTSR